MSSCYKYRPATTTFLFLHVVTSVWLYGVNIITLFRPFEGLFGAGGGGLLRSFGGRLGLCGVLSSLLLHTVTSLAPVRSSDFPFLGMEPG